MQPYKDPTLVRKFNFAFEAVNPDSVLGGSDYVYHAELVRAGNITILPASRSEEDIAIVEVTGMPMAEVIRWFDHPDHGYHLARAGQVVEIAEVHRDIQEKGRFYAAGESWPWSQKERLFLFLDNELPDFTTGRASHIDRFGPRDDIDQSLGNGLKAFVAVIGDCPRLKPVS